MTFPNKFKLTVEKPAAGVYRHDTWGDATIYTVECDCHDPDHSVTVWIEFDAEHDIPTVEMTIYADMVSPRFGNLWERIKWSMACLFKGNVSLQHNMVLTDQSAKNFAGVLDDASAIYSKYRAE
jgi:hypothetical protein